MVVEGKLFGNRKWKGEAAPEKGKEDGFKEERLFFPLGGTEGPLWDGHSGRVTVIYQDSNCRACSEP